MSGSFINIRTGVSRLDNVINKCQSFKIGKTSDLEKRHDAPDYRDKYPNMEVLYSSRSEVMVSYVEKILIDACISDVADKCDNEKSGKESVGDRMDSSSIYYVYVVWR